MCIACVQAWVPFPPMERKETEMEFDIESSSHKTHLPHSTCRESAVQRGNGFCLIAQLLGDKAGFTLHCVLTLHPYCLQYPRGSGTALAYKALGSSISTRKSEKYKTSQLDCDVNSSASVQGLTWPEVSGLIVIEYLISMMVELHRGFQGHAQLLGNQSGQPGLCKCPESGLVTEGQDPQALGAMEDVMVNIN